MTDEAPACLPALTRNTFVAPTRAPPGLSHWFEHYLVLEAASGAANTYLAKRRDLNLFLAYVQERLHSDHPDDWTKPVTVAFLRVLENTEGRKASTVRRGLELVARYLRPGFR